MGVLDGIKILEMARVAPAELPGMMLADMGAEVLKIETPEPGTPPTLRPSAGQPSPSSTATSGA